MQGVVLKFDKEKGYGFIRAKEVSKDIFVHIHDIQGKQGLYEGQNVVFDVVQTEKGLSAVNVTPGRKRLSPFAIYGATLIIFTALSTGFLLDLGWNWVFAYFASINAAAFLFYGYDKGIAGSSILRVPEIILHCIAFSGGSPASLIAQRLFHHKTIKSSFQIVYWTIVLTQVLLIYFMCK